MSETLRSVDGRQVLRIERRLPHPPEKVWRAVTEPEHLSQWYPFRAEKLELHVGGQIWFDDGQGTSYGAVVTALDPPRLFAFSEHPPAAMTRESDDLIQFELRPDADGCVLVFTHIFDDRPAAASYATGWHGCLVALGLLLDGKPAAWPAMSVQRYEAYVRSLGLADGTIEETPSGWLVRYERQLMRQPIDTVWTTLMTATKPPTVGDRPPAACTIAGVTAGSVTAVEAPTLLEYAWEVDGRPAGTVRWELSTGPGGARILLTQTGSAEDTDLRSAALAEWRRHIEALVERLVAATG